jgi:hypothetical protein
MNETKKYEHVFDICFSIESDSEDPDSISWEDKVRALELAYDCCCMESESLRIQWCETYES